MFSAIKRWLASLFKPKPQPQPIEPKPPYGQEDQDCNVHQCRVDDPHHPESEYTPEKYRAEYVELWLTMEYPVYRSGSNGRQDPGTIEWSVNYIKRHRARYELAAELVFERLKKKVPWELIGCLHLRECGGDFKKNLMNGQPLNMRTTWVPRGYGPWATWEDSVVDAFRIKDLPDVWSIANTLYFTERYNGMGYRTTTRAAIVGYSPYLWAFSNHYKGGYFVSDGKFSSDAIAKGVGVAIMLKELEYRQR